MEECSLSVGIDESKVLEKRLPKDRLHGTAGDSCGVALTKLGGSHQIKGIRVQGIQYVFSPLREGCTSPPSR